MSIGRPLLLHENDNIYEDKPRSNDVLAGMCKFYQDSRFCDVNLIVEEERFQCHRIVLAASSLYFERMFSTGMSETKASEIQLNGVSAAAMRHLVEFSYTSQLCVTKDYALEIFEAADMLQFLSAKSFCEEYLIQQVNINNCLDFLLYADTYSCQSLYLEAKLAAAKHFRFISATEDYLKLPEKHIFEILKDDNIDMEYEEHIYDAMKYWLNYDLPERKKSVPILFQCIRLNFVSRWHLIEVISNDELIKESNIAMHIVRRAKDQMLALGHTYEIPWQMPPSRKCTGMTEKIIYLHTHDPHLSESELHLFDPVNKSWSTASRPCPLASEMSSFETVANSVIVVGGLNHKQTTLNEKSALNTIYEFKTMSIFPSLWYSGVFSMSISRYLHSTVVMDDSILFLLGGFDEFHILQSSVFMADADKRYQFEPCPSMLYALCRPAIAIYEHNIYVFGGFNECGVSVDCIQKYDVQRHKWSELPYFYCNQSLIFQFVTCVRGIMYLLVADMIDIEKSGAIFNCSPDTKYKRIFDRILTFNPHNYQWKTVYLFNEIRTGNFCITSLDDKIYITGGLKNAIPYKIVECYDPVDNTLEIIGNCRDGDLSLCTTLKVMHENFGL